MELDIRAIVLSIVIVSVVNMFFLVAYNSQNKDRTIKFFTISQFFYFAGFIGISLRSQYVEQFWFLFSNMLLVFGLGTEGISILLLLEISNKKSEKKFIILLVILEVFMIISGYFKLNIIFMATICGVLILIYPIQMLIKKSKNDLVIKAMTILYSLLFVMFILRVIKLGELKYYFFKSNLTNLSTIFFLVILVLRSGSAMGFILITNKKINRKNIYFSKYDGLTDIFNRRTFIEISEETLNAHNKKQQYCAFLLIDIDFFKRINDSYGHLCGDKVLVEFAKILKTNIRVNDYCGRYGGEEFVVLLTNIDEKSAMTIAERIRKEVELSKIDEAKYTISIGLSMLDGRGKNIDDLYREADKSLYKAKSMGRNRTVVF